MQLRVKRKRNPSLSKYDAPLQGSLMSSKYVKLQAEAESKARMYSDLKPIMASEDMKEGVASFLERREAVFTGK